MLAADVSNYTTGFEATKLQAAGVGLVVIQAFPEERSQYAQQHDQMAACKAAGLPFHAYIYDYLTDPSWRDKALKGLSGVALPEMVWLDVEDVEPAAVALNIPARVAAISASLAACDAWATANARPRTGIYTGAWWWRPYTADTTQFSDRALWFSQYDGDANVAHFTSFGGWSSAAMKQYAGSTTLAGVSGLDLDVFDVDPGLVVNNMRETPADYPFPDWRQSAIAYRGALDSVVPELEAADAALAATPDVQARLSAYSSALEGIRAIASAALPGGA